MVAIRSLQRPRGIIDGLRPRKRIQQQQSSRVAFLQLDLQSVISGETGAEVGIDVIELRVRATRFDAERTTGRVRKRLVQVGIAPQTHAVVAGVAEVEHQIARQFALDCEVPVLHVWRP